MRRRTRRFRVGLLALATATMFVSLVLFIVGSSMRTDVKRYYILFEENVKGMVIGSKTNFQGVPIGSVTDIRFEAGDTLVEISIDPRKAIIQDVTTARLDRLLVTGQVTVELEGYSPDAREVPEGMFVQARTNPLSELTMGLPEVLRSVHGVLVDTRSLLSKTERILSDDNLARLERVLDNVDRASAGLPETIDGMRAAIESTKVAADQIAVTAGVASRWIDRERLAALLARADGVLARFDAVGTTLAAVAAEVRDVLGDSRNTLRDVLLGARDALRDVRVLARNLQVAPSSLLFGVDAGELDLPARPARGDR